MSKRNNFEEALYFVSSTVKTMEEFVHAFNVSRKFEKDYYKFVIAAVHDIVEDGYSDFEKLRDLFNLDQEQMKALDALTRRKGEEYSEYIVRVMGNELAREIKLCDLEDNIDRCTKDLKKHWSKLCRYALAYGKLVDRD